MPRDPQQLYRHDRILGPWLDRILPTTVRPNHITVLRFLLVPIILWRLIINDYVFGSALFLFAAATDALDGTLARIRKQITDWGTRYDPLADKLLISSVILLFALRQVSLVLGVVLVVLDLGAAIFGAYHAYRGRILTANRYGKIKMFLEVLGVALMLGAFAFGWPALIIWAQILFALAIVAAVISIMQWGV